MGGLLGPREELRSKDREGKNPLGEAGGCKELAPFSGISQGLVSFPGGKGSFLFLFVS